MLTSTYNNLGSRWVVAPLTVVTIIAAGMVGTAHDFMIFLEALRTGGAPILTHETVEVASQNQVGSLREQEEPGWGFGFLSGVLTDPERAGSPAAAGMLSWGGVYGNSWFLDPVAGLSVVALTNTGLEGCMGAFPTEIQAAILAGPGIVGPVNDQNNVGGVAT